MTTKTKDAKNAPRGEGPVELTLAHPLPGRRAYELGLGDGDEDLEVGQVIRVDRQRGRQFINAGLVQVDPEDREAVRKVLDLDDVSQVQVPSESITTA